ncbi:phosphoribosyltransferase [Staphylococcus saprophyticus]|uniref:Phosphoribosyltransferase n=1 Tax=Staphylococcus cohnii TaxID=29382 RepID=A0ABT6J232_9STAP|nr:MULTISPECIES: phosphoribosyltransferase [Staphylococcus]MBU8681436.1 phosphoribosyltransferase [Staphylococcus saprophyticus]MDH5140483.1 phosphoribosyltransferase [Staphylococcus cohnii]MDH5158804.1 phosphoribosyltransferase [Staphylococcus cohnii]MDH5170066.1 phosphoribosyltransferase [Staphylococcus cohnii]MDW3800438.1 phosphoribosyltransferase [Staphylococcus saprophyticus]
MKQKLIIISKKLVFEVNGEIKKDFDSFHQKVVEQNIKIAVITNNASQLSSKLSNYSMCGAFTRNTIKESLKEKRNELGIVILGVVKEDAFLAFNHKIPLFKAKDYCLDLGIEIDNKVGTYGIELSSTDDLIHYMNIISENISPYLQHSFSDEYIMISLFNANTKGYQTREDIEYKEEIQRILKENYSVKIDKTKMLNLFNFLLLSEYFNNPILKEVKYWGTFPSSDKSNDNTTISYIKEVIRKVINTNRSNEEILIRTESILKKHHSSTRARNENKCQSDFDSMKINDYYKGKLQGATVCIIDDYTTYGFSAEAAKNLLLQEGVEKLIVITLGKFGYDYNEVNYNLIGNLYEGGYSNQFISTQKHKLIPNNDCNTYFQRIKQVINI